LRKMDDWIDFWQDRLAESSTISDIEAEAGLSELARITKNGVQKAKAADRRVKSDFVDSFYLKRIV
jgi:hypothetical protein